MTEASPQPDTQTWVARISWRRVLLGFGLLLYLFLAGYQLGLPGLHYDEAKEAGLNAMELVIGAPVTAFRDSAMTLFGLRLPLMVQDYIGALNVYLAVPFITATGIGVPNLRVLALLIGFLTLIAVERATSQWVLCAVSGHLLPVGGARASISWAGVIAVLLLAASPSFVFWSRQGIFVTNLMQPLCFWMMAAALHWLRTGRRTALWSAALAGGLALYAKLLAIWIVGPFALFAGGWWIRRRSRHGVAAPQLTIATLTGALLCFLVPLIPLLFFNWQTGGTVTALFGNLDRSYYGVDNRAFLANLAVRMEQLVTVLTGRHFWYLGGLYGNPAAFLLASAAVIAGLWRAPRLVAPPLALLIAAILFSSVTISDLFVTHFALLQPLAAAIVSIGAMAAVCGPAHRCPSAPSIPLRSKHNSPSWAALSLAGLVLLWLLLDLTASVRYHQALSRSGGLADHSDAGYHLAYHLRYNGMGAPIALDWGMEAPVRYLSKGTVRPVEIFGYASLAQPDGEFGERLAPFLANPDNVYLLRAPGQAVFLGRREAFFVASEAAGGIPVLESSFGQRDGTPLYEIWRIIPAPADE